MFARFFLELRANRVPVSLTEYLTLIEGTRAGVPSFDVEGFYYFARACLVKDERHMDRFDQVFGAVFKGLEPPAARDDEEIQAEIPAEWLRALAEKVLSEEEKAQVEALGGWEKLMDTLRQRLEEQKGAHRGGDKWIGTGGTSPFGAHGYNPEGIRIGQRESRHRRAVKVWDRREFRDFSDDIELGTRNIKLALRRLREFARTGAPTELDLGGTISATARNAGYLDLKMIPERHNAVKVLLLLDHGGSMDDHVRTCGALFSAARAEFKNLEFYYFHNCPYERLWKAGPDRRTGRATETEALFRTHGRDWKLILVGDAAMSPYEITMAGGSVEHWNEEPGAVWMSRLLGHFDSAVWLNPSPRETWRYVASTGMIDQLMEGRMFPLTLAGLDDAMKTLLR